MPTSEFLDSIGKFRWPDVGADSRCVLAEIGPGIPDATGIVGTVEPLIAKPSSC